jgi:hypothetical protein
MVTASTSVDGITADFPKTIDKIHGEPTRRALIDMHKLLCTNAASVTTNLGGGNHGHLTLLITAEEYLEEAKQVFVVPLNPGDDPPTTSNPAEQSGANDKFKRQQRAFEKYHNADKALKKQIENTVEADFLSALNNELTGFGRVTALQMVTYLYKTYGKIDDEDIEKNNVDMMKPYDPELPLAKLTKQLEDGRSFAHIGQQIITEKMMISKGITLLRQTEVFHDDIKEWNRMKDDAKTWDSFKLHFHRAHQERRKTITTAGQQGYNGAANTVYGNVPNEEHLAMQQAASEALDSISDGLSSHQDSISELTQANAVLSNTNTTMAAQLAQMMQQMTAMQGMMQQQMSPGATIPQAAAVPPALQVPRKRRPPLPWNYCWSHGKCKHSGTECTLRKAGHKVEATLVNKLGGSTYGL